MNDIAVVILNYNGAHYLEKFLPSVVKYSHGCRVIVADNNSTDQSLDILINKFPQIEILPLDQNYGFSLGYNKALEKVEAEYFVLLNSDVEVSEGWWQSSIALLKASENIAAVQPKILSYHNKEYFEYAGAGGGFIDNLGYPFCRGRLFLTLEKDGGQYNDVLEVFWASGACMFIKSRCFHEVSGFDPDFFAHMEEIDLCWRLQRLNYKIIYNGHSHIFHVGGGTLEKSHPGKTYLNFRNGLSLLYKNYTRKQVIKLLPVRIALDWIAALKFTVFDSPRHGYAVIRAHKYFFSHLLKNKSKRSEVKGKLPKQLKTIYQKSVVIEYFLKRRKFFTELTDNDTLIVPPHPEPSKMLPNVHHKSK